MTAKEIRKNKIYRSVIQQLAQISEINSYHGKVDVERSVRIINAMKKRAAERIAAGRDETEVNKWLDEMIGSFNDIGYTYDEISGYYRNKVNEIKNSAIETLTQKVILLNKLAREESDDIKQRSIENEVVKYMNAICYITENVNYNG